MKLLFNVGAPVAGVISDRVSALIVIKIFERLGAPGPVRPGRDRRDHAGPPTRVR